MGKADLHLHTAYSPDATTTVRGVLKCAKDARLDLIAVTDHDEIRGAFEARELASQYGVHVVTGVEVSTAQGHLVGLFIEKVPPAGLSLAETVLRIGDMGGIAIAPHPNAPYPSSPKLKIILEARAHPRAKNVLVGIEVYTMGYRFFDKRTREITRPMPLSQVASSDSHVYWTVGTGRTQFAGSTPAELRQALEQFSTIAIPAAQEVISKPLIAWMNHMVLKRLGYVFDSSSPERPIRLSRYRRNQYPVKAAKPKTSADR